MPPSTNSSTPATQLLSSEARKETAFATSSVVPTRPSGMPGTACSTNCDTCCSLIPRLVWYPGVGTTPGLMTLTRMFLPLRSTLHVRANERTAALLAPSDEAHQGADREEPHRHPRGGPAALSGARLRGRWRRRPDAGGRLHPRRLLQPLLLERAAADGGMPARPGQRPRRLPR